MSDKQDSITRHHQAAQTALREGQLRSAHQHCLTILRTDPSHADAWFICGLIAAHNGLVTKATDIQRKAIGLAPKNPEYRIELAKQLTRLGDLSAALEQAAQALQLKPKNLYSLDTLGTVLSHGGEHETAIDCYRLAIRGIAEQTPGLAPPTTGWQADLYFNYATSLGFAGDIEGAEQAYEQAIKLIPGHYQAHAALAQLRRQTPTDNHVERLLDLKDLTDSALDRLHLGHALAKEYEDLGDFKEALQSLAWAKTEQARLTEYQWQNDAERFARLKALFSQDLIHRTARDSRGCQNAAPIFIVGMPRTGTTLLERILGGHSQVTAAGELQDFALQVRRLTGSSSADPFSVENLEKSAQLDCAMLGRAYMESTRSRAGKLQHFTDKYPLNFMYLGLIHLALPRAKLICLRRDPMDTCLSNYRQLFAPDFKHYHYSYDLLDCARYYIEFDALMRHWREVLPGLVHEVHYEQLVTDTKRVARELLDFCGLEWEPDCLEFHTQPGSVSTPSTTQVRQPIYRSSLNRWHRYGATMDPVYDLLNQAGCYPAEQAPGT